eukprot:347722-Chlamydomonas_euryale.AAC.1
MRSGPGHAGSCYCVLYVGNRWMFLFGGSNDANFFQQLQSKDEQLQSKDQQLTKLLDMQRDLLKSKEDVQRKLVLEVRQVGQLQMDVQKLSNELKNANDKILGVTGKRNLRGALELVAI